jgi:RNA polymerase sigma factor (sigma-70 family)
MSTKVSARLLATQPDERLLELVREGHERAFEAIVLRYRRVLRAYCRRMGLSDTRADDVLQQSFLKAWLSLQSGTDVRLLRPWLYRIVHNTAVNVIRSSPNDRPGGTPLPPIELLAAPESALEDTIAAREALTDLASLPKMQREAIVLSAIEGRSHEEIAGALGVSAPAVRGLLYRARSAMRAAAAAFTPGSLISWASGSVRRAAPSTARLAELTGASGMGDTSAMLVKGAALAGSAALAAGAVFVPLHARATHAHGHPDAPPTVLPDGPHSTASPSPATLKPAGGATAVGPRQPSLVLSRSSHGVSSVVAPSASAPIATAPPASPPAPASPTRPAPGSGTVPGGATVLVGTSGGASGAGGPSGGQTPKTGGSQGEAGDGSGAEGKGAEGSSEGGTGKGSSSSDDSEEAPGGAPGGAGGGSTGSVGHVAGESDDGSEPAGSSAAAKGESGKDS